MLFSDKSLNAGITNPVPNFYEIAYGNGIWLANGNYTLYRSTDDGLTWQLVLTSQSFISKLSYAGGYFFCVAGRGKYSIDGITWLENNAYYTPAVNPEGVDVGVVDAYVATVVNPGYTSYNDIYQSIWVQISNTNTGACTLDINGYGALPVVQNDGVTPIDPGILQAGKTYKFTLYWTMTPDGWTVEEITAPQAPSSAFWDFSGKVAYGNGTYVLYGSNAWWDGNYGLASSSDLIAWQQCNDNLPHMYADINSVRYIGGVFYAVGDSGTLLTSADGTTWTYQRGSALATLWANLIDIAYDGNLYMIFGDGGEFLTSPDGIIWTDQSYLNFYNIFRVLCYGGDTWALTNNSNNVGMWKTSDSGTTWVPVDTILDETDSGDITDIGTIVVGNYNGNIRRSTNGTNFTTIVGDDGGSGILGFNNGSTVVSYNYIYSAFGNKVTGIRISLDEGATWTGGYRVLEESGSTDMLAWTYGGGLYIMVGYGGRIITSPDGMTWTTQTSGTVNDLSTVIYAGGLWIACGTSGTIVTSANGTAWSTASVPPAWSGDTVWNIAYDGSIYLARFGNQNIATSLDGTTYSILSTLPGTGYSLVWTGTSWLVGSTSDYYKSTDGGATWSTISRDTNNTYRSLKVVGSRIWTLWFGIMAYSDDDGATWTSLLTGYGSGSLVRTVYSCPGGTYAYIQQDYTRLKSLDGGNTWTNLSTTLKSYLRFRYLNGSYFMANSNQLLTSANGVSWQSNSLLVSDVITDIIYNSGLYVAVGNNLGIWTSADGITWTWRKTAGNTRPQSLDVFYSAAVGGGIYVAVGSGGAIYSSADALTWSSQISPVGTSGIFSCLYDGAQFVALSLQSNTGKLVTSADGINWSATSIAGQTASVKIYPNSLSFDGSQYILSGIKVDTTAGYNTYSFVATSLNLSTWSAATFTDYSNQTGQGSVIANVIQYNDSWYAATTGGSIYVSQDLANFESVQNTNKYMGQAYQNAVLGEFTLTNGVPTLTASQSQYILAV